MRALSWLLAEVAGLSLSFRKPAAEAVRQTCRGPFTDAGRRYARRRYAREAWGEGGGGGGMTGRGGTCGVAGRDLWGVGLSCSSPPVYLSFPPSCPLHAASQVAPWRTHGSVRARTLGLRRCRPQAAHGRRGGTCFGRKVSLNGRRRPTVARAVGLTLALWRLHLGSAAVHDAPL